MKLTGIAKEEFFKIFGVDDEDKDFSLQYFDIKTEVEQNALIIDFFDSIGIVITPDIARLSEDNYGFTATIWSKGFRKSEYVEDYISRQEALNAAIEKANELYNNLVQK